MANKIDFTKQQEKVINEKNKNLMVSASAGSGKTTVMIERLAKLIEDGTTTLDKVLVLTFTNNSANDMRRKLYKILNEKNTKKCRDAIFGVATADISNIHQFCKRLIQKYFYIVDVDPSFSVISETESDVIKDQAFDEVIRDSFTQQPDKLDNLLENNFDKRNFDNIKNILLNIYRYMNVLDDPNKWIAELAASNYNDDMDNNLAIRIIINAIKQDISFYLTKFTEINQHIIEAYDPHDFDDIKTILLSLKKLNSSQNNEELISDIINTTFVKKDYRKKNDIGEFRRAEINPVFSELKTSMESYKSMFNVESILELKEFLKSPRSNVEFLCELAHNFSERYQEIKAEKYLLDFNDLEKKANLLLQNDIVKQEISRKYQFCFVDEYQDINNLQEAILSVVGAKSSYFGVGDAKQAIYGFRLCSPEIFINKFDQYKKSPDKNIATSLNQNFRSRFGILNFVNKVFEVIMTEKTSHIDYKNTAFFETGKSDEINVDIMLALKKEEKEKVKLPAVYSVEKDPGKENDYQKSAKTQASLTAEIVEKLVTQSVAFRDIAILSRSKSTQFVKHFCEALSSYGVPIKTNFNVNLLDYTEISVLHNLIKLCNNFKDDVVLFKVLTSPLFNIDIEYLAKLRNNTDRKFFFESILDHSSDTEIASVIEAIKELRLRSQNIAFFDFVKYIIDKYDYVNLVSLISENSVKNLDQYISFIKGLNLLTISDYCRLTQNDTIEIKTDDTQNDLENAISINTIHSSKGLEYPYVILIGCDKPFSFIDLKADSLISKDLGVGIKTINENDEEKAKTLVYSAIKISKKQEYVAEEMRLLYVASTRAKEHLFIIGEISEDQLDKLAKFDSERDILNSKSYLELILRSLSDSEIAQIKNRDEAILHYGGHAVAKCELISADSLKTAFEIDKPLRTFSAINEADIKPIKDKILAFEKLTNINNSILKNNVSALIKSNEEIDYSNYSFEYKEQGISPELGTLYHKYFSSLKFNGKELGLKIQEPLKQKYFNDFIASDFYKSIVGKKILQEVPFLLYDNLDNYVAGDDKILLQGIIDLLVIEDDGFWVVDYKATHISNDQIKQRYGKQLELYATAGERILNKKCKKMIIYKIFSAETLDLNRNY